MLSKGCSCLSVVNPYLLSSAICRQIVNVCDHFVGLALKKLNFRKQVKGFVQHGHCEFKTGVEEFVSNRHLVAQSQRWKHQNNM